MKILELFEHNQIKLSRSDFVDQLSSDGNSTEAESIAELIATYPNGELRRFHPLGNEQPAAIVVHKSGGVNFVLKFTSHFFVGIDWIIPGKLAVRVRPKIDQKSISNHDTESFLEVDVLGMLNEVVSANLESGHYDGLITFPSDSSPIEKGGDTIGAYQFLIAQYLSLLKRLVQKGLRRQYVAHEEIYKRKLRGRILWSKTFSKPSAHLADRIACEPVIFTQDTDENRYLKAGLNAAGVTMGKLPSGLKSYALRQQFRYVLKGFEEVSDTDESTRPRFVKTNPVFKDYSTAIEMTRNIFSMDSISFARTQNQATVLPHWLYMPKLFELYVYAKLLATKQPGDQLTYHLQVGRQELDYLCNVNAFKETVIKSPYAIVDAKYKLRYDNDSGTIDRDDARQLSGYARFRPVFDKLNEWGMPKQDTKPNIPCLIVHPTLNPLAPTSIDFSRIRESNNWLEFYLLDIRLPILQ